MPTFRITSVDYAPIDLVTQVPFECNLVRMMHGSDSQVYWVAKPRHPLSWKDDGRARLIMYVLLSARHVGESLDDSVGQIAVALAYVTDQSLLNDAFLDFEKCRYIAIGTAERIGS